MEPRHIRLLILVALVVILLTGSRTIASFAIEHSWWREVGQLDTWYKMLLYRVLPALIAGALGWAALVWAHERGMTFAGVPRRLYSWYRRIAWAVLLVLAVLLIGGAIDSDTVMAFFGSLGAEPPPQAWQDPVFDKDLSFYLFNLPFYRLLLRFLFTTALLAILIFWATGRGWQLFEKLQRFRAAGGSVEEFDPGPHPLLLRGATRTSFALILGSVILLAAATWFFLGRYTLLLNHHDFMTGMDYVDERVTLPLRWLVILALAGAVPLLWTRRLKVALGVVVGALLANAFLPGVVRSLYVRPNELSLERPYIARHIEATNVAYKLTAGQQMIFEASTDEQLNVAQHSTLVDNIRLWDTAAFTDTITQIQALRPYYRFADIDIDRYTIDGKIKQVLLSPREIDVDALPVEARASWVNSRFIYTHGYGVVMAEVNRTTRDGLPVLLVQDAPPTSRIEEVELSRPGLYFGELTHEPVFVNTDQEEFDYPSGDQNIMSSYEGEGGFPIHSLGMRLAAALREAEYNILLTGLTNPDSRMMIYRNVRQRLQHMAGFIRWDTDPYLVVNDDGRLTWIVDGYTVSEVHPYSAPFRSDALGGRLNYIRNSVKATVDAYHGTTRLYVFDEGDPIIQAYWQLFPQLFHPKADMPNDLRTHVRYPLLMFDVQAEIYRVFHMRDPGVFYNKEDVWEVGRSLSGDTGRSDRMNPTYIVATMPGESEAEFILMLPFTPRGKDNLVGWMAARCDGENYGELVFYQLSKQQLIYGPNQIESRINQDREIARDLSLWNQQGSRVLRGELLALPMGDAFLYVESIYIQAESARMPQLRKVVLAMGNRLIYEDTFEAALLRLSRGEGDLPAPEPEPEQITEAPPPPAEEGPPPEGLAGRLTELRRQAQELAEELERLEQDLAETESSP